MTYFFDSSALVKGYAAETGSKWVVETLEQNRILIAGITIVEVISAIVRRKREGSLSSSDATKAIADFRLDISSEYAVIELTGDIIEDAASLTETHELRAYDAVQLATALQVRNHLASGTADFTLVSADKALNEAAISEGLSVEYPTDH
ncbi:MAG: type II toxin-antitoxin system VapC family toxin [Acidobacteria bacterium]|nr:type II toxin-antitoxin system VapC family toxin [Acidobacteriota bacterium]